MIKSKKTKKQSAKSGVAQIITKKLVAFASWVKTPIGLIATILALPFLAYGLLLTFDYGSDFMRYSSITSRNSELKRTVEVFDTSRDNLSVIASKEYCNYNQGKFGDEGGPYCGYYAVLRYVKPIKSLTVSQYESYKLELENDLHSAQLYGDNPSDSSLPGHLCSSGLVSDSYKDGETISKVDVYGLWVDCWERLRRWQFFERGSPQEVKLY